MRDGLAPAIRVEILVLVESPPDEHQLRVLGLHHSSR